MEVLIIIGLVGAASYFLMSGGGGMSGTTLTADQIAGYAQNAGWSGSDLVMAVAVALAESSGRTGVVGDLTITPGGSVGLWQINLKAHPEFAGQDLTDPQTNANAGYSVYAAAGHTFTPWSTYNNGISPALLSEASSGVSTMQANQTANG